MHLEPCPFCGGEAIYGSLPASRHIVKCLDCGCKMEQDRFDKVEGLWNTRITLETLNQNFTISFQGECTKQVFYKILDYTDNMKLEGYFFKTHERRDLQNGNIKINYILEK